MGIINRRGVWYLKFIVDGRTYRESTGLEATERNRSAALHQAELKRQAILEGRSEPKVKARLFSDAAAEFLTWAEQEHRAHPNTAKRLRASFASLLERFGARTVMSLGEGDLEDFKTWRRKASIKEVSLRHDLHALSKFFRYAIAQRWARRNPVDAVKLPSDADAVRIHVLTTEEERAYFARARGPLYDLGRLMLNQGCRPEELLALRKCDVDLERRELRIVAGKSLAARRTLDLTAESLSILAARLNGTSYFTTSKDVKKYEAVMRRMIESPWVFPSKIHPGRHVGRLNSQHDALIWKLNYDAKGDQRSEVNGGMGVFFVLYDLRHTFATRFAERCHDLTLLMKILGHSSLRMVTRYVHPTREAQKAAMQKFEAVKVDLEKAEMVSQRKM